MPTADHFHFPCLVVAAVVAARGDEWGKGKWGGEKEWLNCRGNRGRGQLDAERRGRGRVGMDE